MRELPKRIPCGYVSLRYERFISVRTCRRCGRYGHSKDQCTTADEYITEIAKKARNVKKCAHCVIERFNEIIDQPSNNTLQAEATQLALTFVKHGMYDEQSCGNYKHQVRLMEKRYDF
jgi:hypothetical protein